MHFEQIVDAIVHWLCVLQHVELVHLSVLVEPLRQERPQHLEVADECNSFVGLAILLEHLLHLPGPLPELLGRLVYHLVLDELQQLLLLLLIARIPVILEVNLAGVTDVLAEDLDEPQLGVVGHVPEIELGEVSLLFLDVTADVTGEPEHLREDRVHLHADVTPPEDLLAGLERPAVRGDEDDVDILGLELLPGAGALRLALLRDAAVDVLLGVGDLPVEVGQLDAILPAHIGVEDLLKAQEALVEVGLGVADSDEVALLLFSWYLFKHIFYC